MKNKDVLKEKFNLPESGNHGHYSINFWLFGNSNKREEYDRLCFDDMKTSKNCIEKDVVFLVNTDSQGRIHFNTFDGDHYLLKKNGEVVEFHYNLKFRAVEKDEQLSTR
ncbi:DUF943 family protein [Erwinia sp. CPCC 100877]|nr:DUF943 family protein [Erwinia sp. CPCC 100877]